MTKSVRATDFEMTNKMAEAAARAAIVNAMVEVLRSGAYPGWLETDRMLIRAGFTAAEINEHGATALALAGRKA